ncbi:MAG: hypothetical protein K0R98_168 [Rickettsiaceae bacterium]|nr:hypothetical protein [Rickettsiaceae bacterium]
MLIYELLENDHRIVLSALDSIEATMDADLREEIFHFMRTELTIHSKAEEEVLYKPLMNLGRKKLLLEGSFDDHDEIEDLMMNIEDLSAKQDEWLDKVLELRYLIEQHVDKEETEVFSLSREMFSDRKAKEIAGRMMAEKGKLAMENPFALIGRKFKEMRERY